MTEEELRALADEAGLPENVERLLRHLEHGSLAASLVLVHHAGHVASRPDSLKNFLNLRLAQVRESLHAESL